MQSAPESVEIVLPASGQDGKIAYGYLWAVEQPLSNNAENLIRNMVKTKTAKYLETELNRILRDLKKADATKEKVLVNRFIVIAKAKARRYSCLKHAADLLIYLILIMVGCRLIYNILCHCKTETIF